MKNNKKTVFIVIFFLALAVLITSIVMIVKIMRAGKSFDGDRATLPSVTETSATETDKGTETEEILPDSPVDFAAWQAINPDIYAWITVPGTEIDYPILQSDEDDLFYLRRNFKKENDVAGCIFTQSLNSKDFTDPNTLVYGHYMYNSTFFGPLHKFEDKEFFDNNDTITVTIPGHIFTYRIFAAYEYDSRHILYSFDFSDKKVYADYLKSCLNPTALIQNVREGVNLTTDDKIITLSTCMPSGDDSVRYLVQGVLTNDKRTK